MKKKTAKHFILSIALVIALLATTALAAWLNVVGTVLWKGGHIGFNFSNGGGSTNIVLYDSTGGNHLESLTYQGGFEVPMLFGNAFPNGDGTVTDYTGQPAYKMESFTIVSENGPSNDVSIQFKTDGLDVVAEVLDGWAYIVGPHGEPRWESVYFYGEDSDMIAIGDLDTGDIVHVDLYLYTSAIEIQWAIERGLDISERDFALTCEVNAKPIDGATRKVEDSDKVAETVAAKMLEKVPEKSSEKVEDIGTGSEDLGTETIPTPPTTGGGN